MAALHEDQKWNSIVRDSSEMRNMFTDVYFMHISLSSNCTKVELNRKYRMHDLITQQNIATSTYINARSVFMRKVLHKGRYIIIPSTFKPDTLGEFMLRVYTDQDSGCKYELPIHTVCHMTVNMTSYCTSQFIFIARVWLGFKQYCWLDKTGFTDRVAVFSAVSIR